MSLADLVRGLSARPEDPVQSALRARWAWTRSPRHAVPARELYVAARAALPGVGLATVYAAVRTAVADLGGWFVVRGNLRHVRGCRLNHMTDVEAEAASRALRKPWRGRSTGVVK